MNKLLILLASASILTHAVAADTNTNVRPKPQGVAIATATPTRERPELSVVGKHVIATFEIQADPTLSEYAKAHGISMHIPDGGFREKLAVFLKENTNLNIVSLTPICSYVGGPTTAIVVVFKSE